MSEQWTVYRDGERWSVSANDMHEALDLAQRVRRNIGEAAIMRGAKAELYVRAGTSVESGGLGASLRPATERARCALREVDDAAVAYLGHDGLTLYVHPLCSIEHSNTPAWGVALNIAEAAADRLREAKTRAVCYVSVAIYKSGKREGLPRFTRAHGDDYRGAVLAAIESNAARLLAIQVEETCVASTLGCLPVVGEKAWQDVGRLDQGALEKLEGQLTRVRGLAERLEMGVAVHTWLADISIATATARVNARSVELHGYGVGTRCLLPPGEHDDEPHGPGTVVSIHVSTERSNYGPDEHELHDRLVEIPGVGEVYTNVDNLRPRD